MVDSNAIIVRPATPDDADALTRFIRPFVEQGRLLPRTLDEMSELIDKFFVAELASTVIGCAVLEIYSPKLAEIRSLAVSPDVQGRGIGKRLVAACLDRARNHNVFEVMAITSSDPFFQSMGFHYTLPGEKRALFYVLQEDDPPQDTAD